MLTDLVSNKRESLLFNTAISFPCLTFKNVRKSWLYGLNTHFRPRTSPNSLLELTISERIMAILFLDRRFHLNGTVCNPCDNTISGPGRSPRHLTYAELTTCLFTPRCVGVAQVLVRVIAHICYEQRLAWECLAGLVDCGRWTSSSATWFIIGGFGRSDASPWFPGWLIPVLLSSPSLLQETTLWTESVNKGRNNSILLTGTRPQPDYTRV